MSLKILNGCSGYACIDDRMPTYCFRKGSSFRDTVSKHYDGIWRPLDRGFDFIKSLMVAFEVSFEWPDTNRVTKSKGSYGNSKHNHADRPVHFCLVRL